jgi:hypothetical protein
LTNQFSHPLSLEETEFDMWTRRFLVCFLFMATTLSAQAFDRPFPVTAKRGKMTPGYFPDMTIDGKARRLSAGARIWNQDNTIEMPTALRGTDLIINYTETDAGDIDNVWILTSDEARQDLKPQPAAR